MTKVMMMRVTNLEMEAARIKHHKILKIDLSSCITQRECGWSLRSSAIENVSDNDTRGSKKKMRRFSV